jgi:hypothetical protein
MRAQERTDGETRQKQTDSFQRYRDPLGKSVSPTMLVQEGRPHNPDQAASNPIPSREYAREYLAFTRPHSIEAAMAEAGTASARQR